MSRYRILVPLDGSKHAEQSLIYLRALTRTDNPEIVLLSVVDDAKVFRGAARNEARERERILLDAYLHRLSGDLRKIGIKTRAKLRFGRPADEILKEAQSLFPDLIVIPTHGRSGMSRLRFGSVADKVIRAADCHTLVIGSHAAQKESWLESDVEPAFKSILVPLDGSSFADKALPVARFFAEKFDSTLHLVQVVSLPPVGNERSHVVEAIGFLASERISAVGKLQHLSSRVITKVLVGSATSELVRYIEENRIDLVLMTRHGRGGLVRTALGTSTDRLLNGPAPVLIVRPERYESPARIRSARQEEKLINDYKVLRSTRRLTAGGTCACLPGSLEVPGRDEGSALRHCGRVSRSPGDRSGR